MGNALFGSLQEWQRRRVKSWYGLRQSLTRTSGRQLGNRWCAAPLKDPVVPLRLPLIRLACSSSREIGLFERLVNSSRRSSRCKLQIAFLCTYTTLLCLTEFYARPFLSSGRPDQVPVMWRDRTNLSVPANFPPEPSCVDADTGPQLHFLSIFIFTSSGQEDSLRRRFLQWLQRQCQSP